MTAARKLKLFTPHVATPTYARHGGGIRRFGKHHQPYLLALVKAAKRGGLTDHELEGKLHVRSDNARKRRQELVLLGYAQDSGTKRKAPSGRDSTVWQVTESGIAMAETLKQQRS